MCDSSERVFMTQMAVAFLCLTLLSAGLLFFLISLQTDYVWIGAVAMLCVLSLAGTVGCYLDRKETDAPVSGRFSRVGNSFQVKILPPDDTRQAQSQA